MKVDAGSAPAQKAGASPGHRLRAEREKRGFSAQKVAEDLHVDPWMIEALEANQFDRLGAPVYVKGHLRKYAALLGLEPESLVAACEDNVQPVPELAPLKAATRSRPKKPPPSRDLLWVFAVVVLVAVGWWVYRTWWVNRTPAAAESTQMPAPAPEPVASPPTGTTNEPAPAPATAPPPATNASPTGPANAPTAQAEGTPPSTPAPTQKVVRLRLVFAADSWVELYDGNGSRVFFETGAANSTRSFAVAAPLRLFLGYADGVEIEVDGRPVTLPANVRRGNVAHFRLDARGRMTPAGSLAQR